MLAARVAHQGNRADELPPVLHADAIGEPRGVSAPRGRSLLASPIEADLRWVLSGEADGEVSGLCSNFGTMTNSLQRRSEAALVRDPLHTIHVSTRPPAISAFDCEPHWHAVEAAGRARLVRRALEAAGDTATAVLRAVYGVRPAPGGTAFGAAATLAPYAPVAQRAWRRSGTDRGFLEWLVRLSWRVSTGNGRTPEDTKTAAAIRAECDELLGTACRAYQHARDLAGAHRRLVRQQRG
jgi:hypothetical protein